MSHAQDTAYRLRWVILVAGVIGVAAGVVYLFAPLLNDTLDWELVGLLGLPFVGLEVDETTYALIAGGYLGVFLLTQWFFLRPRGDLAIRLTATGTPMRRAIISAAFMAALLDIGLLAILLEVPDRWVPVAYRQRGQYGPDSPRVWLFGLVLAITWAGWAWLFLAYFKSGDQYTRLSRILRGLFAGSVLELVVAAPVHAWVASRRNCYCARGSYTGLIFAGTVLLWCFGPGIVLLFLREKYRREKLLSGRGVECPQCGYNLTGTLDAGRTQCPECGAHVAAVSSSEPHEPPGGAGG